VAVGRPPKPTAQKKAQGTLQKHRENKNEPEFNSLCITTQPPEYFNTYSANIWTYLLKEYEKQKIIETVDIYAFEILCFNFGLWKDCAKKLSENPVLLENESHGGLSSTAQMMNKAFSMCEKMMSRFGLTPSDRSRVGLINKKDEDDESNKMRELCV